MATIANYFEQAQLSLAAYALDLQRGMSGSNQASAYIDKLTFAGMSQKQAEVFANTYAVVDQFSDPLTGFSATVFDKGGVKYFAIRGTETSGFASAVDWLTNVDEVGPDGIAISQGLALLNYLQRLYAASNSAVVQYFYDRINGTIGTTTGTANGLLSGQIPLSTAGHSLGGHLAMIMSRLAPGLVNSVYTYNAPGFDVFNDAGLTSEGFFTLLRNAPIGPITGAIGTAWDSSKMTHWNVEGDVVHNIGLTPGSQGIAFSENANQGVVDAHDIKALTDSLAVYDLFSRIDPALNTADPAVGVGKITAILKAASNTPALSLEAALDSLRVLFKDPGAPLPAPTLATDREQFYQNLYDTGFRNRIATYAGALSIVPLVDRDVMTIEANAFGDLAYRYALKALNPFAVLGEDGIYDQHNPNGELAVYDALTGTGALSSQWVAGRAQFLSWKMGINGGDLLFGLDTGAADNVWYEDKALKDNAYVLTSNVGGVLNSARAVEAYLAKSDARRVFFGGDAAGEALEGGGGADYLYGGAGDDRLNGLAQDDYLQGDAGDDLLAGGTGNDTLIGGKDDDVLDGGLGNDLYIWNKGDGFDAITDAREADGVKRGTIQFLNQTLDGAKTQVSPDNPVEFSDGLGMTYQFFGPEGGEGTLFISKAAEAGNLEVRGFRSGDFGIDLGPVAPIQKTDKFGTALADNGGDPASPIYNDAPNQRLYGLDGDDGFLITQTGTEAYGGPGNDSIYQPFAVDDGGYKFYGEAGSDWLVTWGGSDQLFGGLDDDALSSGNEHDYLEGNEGSDVLAGGLGQDVLVGGDGQDFLLGGSSYVASSNWSVMVDLPSYTVTFYGFNGEASLAGDGGDMMKGETGADFLWGGEGDDALYGGTEDDYLEGDEGSDLLFGEEGNDLLAGDIYDMEGGTTFDQYGQDYLDGGAGDDYLIGQGKSDILIGGLGNDILVGDREGSDLLPSAWHGDDYLDGGDGIDELWGGGGADELFGGSGNDKLYGDDSSID
ncbi:MAG: calcium-binding protein, partial [candidate division NC10 bacterium]|nr:calcium-binding protein [candidate division NC10 bacterium]